MKGNDRADGPDDYLDGAGLTRRRVLQSSAALAAAAALPGDVLAAGAASYDDMLVIDALCFGRDWGDDVYDALRAANYSGIVESLPRRWQLRTPCATRCAAVTRGPRPTHRSAPVRRRAV